jgi:hypothetical protein
LGRHASTNGSKLIHRASDSIALSSFQEEQNARHHNWFKFKQALENARLPAIKLRTERTFMVNSRDVIPTIAAGYSGDQQSSWFGVRRRSLELLGIG